MTIWVHINDPRYVDGRDLDVTNWPVADVERLCSVWDGEIEMFFTESR